MKQERKKLQKCYFKGFIPVLIWFHGGTAPLRGSCPGYLVARLTWVPAQLPCCAAGEFLCALSFLLCFPPLQLMNVSEAVWTWTWKGQRGEGMDASYTLSLGAVAGAPQASSIHLSPISEDTVTSLHSYIVESYLAFCCPHTAIDSSQFLSQS